MTKDFNDAELQQEYSLIPVNTIAKARLVIKPGNHFSDSMLTGSKNGDSVYLNVEFIILEGQHAKRKVFDKIGVTGNDIWVNMGNSKYLRANVVITMHPILLDQLIPIALTQYGLLHSNIT